MDRRSEKDGGSYRDTEKKLNERERPNDQIMTEVSDYMNTRHGDDEMLGEGWICKKKKQTGGWRRYGHQREVNGWMEGVRGKSKKGAGAVFQSVIRALTDIRKMVLCWLFVISVISAAYA